MTVQPHILIAGAGFVGLCTALYLQREGACVTLLDPRGPGEGASKGNAAVLAVDSVLPVAMPGVLREVPGMLLDPLGPLAVRWAYLPQITPWLLRFVAASRPARVEAIAAALHPLLTGAIDAYVPLLECADATSMMQRTGWLCVYETDKHFRKAQYGIELQRRFGVSLELLQAEEIRQAEPSLTSIYRHAVLYPENAHMLDPYRLALSLAEAVKRAGGRIERRALLGFEHRDGGPVTGRTAEGEIPFDAVVIAAGAWSRPLARALGCDVPLDTERGYHMTLPNPGVHLRRPIYSGDHSFAVTPLEIGLRLAGTVELGGLIAPPNYDRAEKLLTHGQRMLQGLNARGAGRWMGFRPSMPDSLPVIGKVPGLPNAVLAFGHGHLGLTLAAITGKLAAALALGRPPALDVAPYRPERFRA
ncbi:MAG TPA: FAD-binding oxidoreductase [Alphaproteobacteria bacterium]|nr:FAD-binding oxidoreductase [Alphaproteobacteria bacterium]